MGFLTRLFAPKILELESRLNTAEALKTWYRDRADELEQALASAEKAFKAEVRRNRAREDLLAAKILDLSGGPKLGAREKTEPTAPVVTDILDASTLTDIQKQDLWDRAVQYCEQKGLSNEMINPTYQQMMSDPGEWLSNY